ncbi:MAG TPA: cupin domain-containing protein [Lacipirellulaceae bacterium]|jgi:mannose-6-phosphate isomerase-like protein (cupin superfamily)|nr:cupin domain-containing protein [Lacipirellulaceae bacterium]
MSKCFQIARVADLPPIACPCGQARRAFVDDADGVASMHVVDISVDARVHYHKRMTEIYYILEGDGYIELDGERHAVRPGDAIMIKPLCRHRAIGRLRVLNVPVPAFDPDDEWFD